MGMYVCGSCFDRNRLRKGNGLDHVGQCEICGHIYGQWDGIGKWVTFTDSIDRPIFTPKPTAFVLNQLINHRQEVLSK